MGTGTDREGIGLKGEAAPAQVRVTEVGPEVPSIRATTNIVYCIKAVPTIRLPIGCARWA